MEYYFAAQVIGFVGYIFYISAPQFKTQKHIMQVGIFAYIILCMQWYLLGQYGLLALNVLGVVVSASALRAQADIAFKRHLWVLYPLGIFVIIMTSHQGLIDYIAICAFVLTLRSQISDNIMMFRGFAFAAGVCLICSSVLAMSIPAFIFNLAFTVSHGFHLITMFRSSVGYSSSHVKGCA